MRFVMLNNEYETTLKSIKNFNIKKNPEYSSSILNELINK